MTASAGFAERRISARDGLMLYARDYGGGTSGRTALLCLAGLTRNSADFDRFARRHAARRRVVSVDYRGRGRSEYDRNWRNYEPLTYLDDVTQVMAALGLTRVVVVGTSMGGILAMPLAVLKPLAVASVVLNDVGPEVESNGLGHILHAIATDRPQPDWQAAVAMLKHTFTTLSLASDEDWLEFARGTFREGSDGALHFDWDVAVIRGAKAGAYDVPDLWPYFRALGKLPVLALRGELSDILSPATFERMAREKPDLVRVTVPKVGHAPSLDEPAARRAIDEFLDRF